MCKSSTGTEEAHSEFTECAIILKKATAGRFAREPIPIKCIFYYSS